MYFYRCTEQQLGQALERVEESGDTLLQAVYKGGRDWVLICRKGGSPEFTEAIRTQRDELRAAKAQRDHISKIVDRAAESSA